MTAFWLLFWLSFYLTPVAYFITQGTISGGDAPSSSHIWVYKGTKTKKRDATSREVWEYLHPGRSWERFQKTSSIIFLVVLLVFIFIVLLALAESSLPLPDDDYERNLHRGGATILGMFFSAVYWPLVFTFFWEMRITVLKVFRWLALFAGPVLVTTYLSLNFIDTQFRVPFSHHWIWLSPFLVCGFAHLDQSFYKRKRDIALDGGNKLGFWAIDMMSQMSKLGIASVSFHGRYAIRDAMKACTPLINIGKLDNLIRDATWFEKSEDILVDLCTGKQMAISMDEIFIARDEIIKAVQAFYFRGVRKMSYDLHPKIQAALEK